MVKRDERVWLEDPSSIMKDLRFIPDRGMDNTTLLNVLTRLIILMALVLFIFRFKDWWLFLIAGLILVCLIWFFSEKPDTTSEQRIEYYQCPKKTKSDISADKFKGSQIFSMRSRY